MQSRVAVREMLGGDYEHVPHRRDCHAWRDVGAVRQAHRASAGVVRDEDGLLEGLRERRETRGCHNRSDFPDTDPTLQVNLVWSPSTGVVREPIAAIPDEVAELMRDVDSVGKLVE
ncbi:hypothetical protein GCM10025863_20860 [Microbacterium suwonense]|uniref:Uncharacterized protein n=1 Tax=Microbacterium suwonense TaxID=683047 RepID=A0ABN6X444_9MICO|nr:hypothetical protein GCM10025863_20860 [Microbacterium suwonense]